MKRLRFIAIILVMSLLSGCFGKANETTESSLPLLEAAIETITLPSVATDDIDLPYPDAEKYPDITSSYTSSDPGVITANGKVTRQLTDMIVTLKLTLKKDGEQVSKSFTVSVPAIETETPPPTVTLDSATLSATEKIDSVVANATIKGSATCSTDYTAQLYLIYADSAGRDKQSVIQNTASEGFRFSIQLENYRTVTSVISLSLRITADNVTTPFTLPSDRAVGSVYGIAAGSITADKYAFGDVNGALNIEIGDGSNNTDLSPKIKALSDANRLDAVMKEINTSVTEDITLVTDIGYGSKIEWKSNSAYLSSAGTVTRPPYGEGDAQVTLVARITNGGIVMTKSYSVKVVESEPVHFAGVRVYETNSSKNFSRASDLTFGSISNATVTIDTTRKNEVEGFGGMLTHGSAYVIYNSPKREQILTELFSPDAAGFTAVRIPIGSSDFPTYVGSTYDENGNQTYKGELKHFTLCDTKGSDDDPLANFSIDVDLQELIPVIKLIQQINPDIEFIATPWTAPAWMKTNNSLNGGWIKEEYEDLYCDYLVKYLAAYKSLGIDIRYMSLQNEARYQTNASPTMQMHENTQIRMLPLLAQKLTQNSLNVKLIILDHNTDMSDYAITVLNNENARRYVGGVGLHGYSSTLTSDNEMGAFINDVTSLYPDTDFYFTEMTAGNASTNFISNMKWAAKNIIMNAVNNGVKMVMYFNFALYTDGMPYIREDWIASGYHCTGLIETSGDSYSFTPEFYALKHLSAFSQGTAFRLDASCSDSSLVCSATVTTDGRYALTVLNTSGSSRTASVSVGNRSFTKTVSANSLTTFTWYED